MQQATGNIVIWRNSCTSSLRLQLQLGLGTPSWSWSRSRASASNRIAVRSSSLLLGFLLVSSMFHLHFYGKCLRRVQQSLANAIKSFACLLFFSHCTLPTLLTAPSSAFSLLLWGVSLSVCTLCSSGDLCTLLIWSN